MDDKVDKGFEWQYYKLSYRRKFIRTLWLIPWTILAIVLIYLFSKSIVQTCIWSFILVTVLVIQLIYNFLKWKKTESKREQIKFQFNRYNNKDFSECFDLADKTSNTIVIKEIEVENYQKSNEFMLKKFFLQITQIDNDVQEFCKETFEKGKNDIRNYLVSLQWVSIDGNELTIGYWGEYVNIELRVICNFNDSMWNISDIYYQ